MLNKLPEAGPHPVLATRSFLEVRKNYRGCKNQTTGNQDYSVRSQHMCIVSSLNLVTLNHWGPGDSVVSNRNLGAYWFTLSSLVGG